MAGIGSELWPTSSESAVGLAVKRVGKPNADNPHIRLDEQGTEKERDPTVVFTMPSLYPNLLL